MSTTVPTTTPRPRGKRGPAPWPAEKVRSTHVLMRLTPGEHADLAARAETAGMPVSTYLRQLATTPHCLK